jgi:hypothetical protein
LIFFERGIAATNKGLWVSGYEEITVLVDVFVCGAGGCHGAFGPRMDAVERPVHEWLHDDD